MAKGRKNPLTTSIVDKIWKELGKLNCQASEQFYELKPEQMIDEDIASAASPDPALLFTDTVRFGNTYAEEIFGLRSTEVFTAAMEAADERYLPGGPPQSPVLDSTFRQWWLFDLRLGPKAENLISIVVQVARRVGGCNEAYLARLEQWQNLRLGVYSVESDEGQSVWRLRDLCTGAELRVAYDLAGEVEVGQQLLWRLFPDGDGPHVAVDRPYVIRETASDEWQACLTRRAGGALPCNENLARNAMQPEGEDADFWLAYVFEGFSGVSDAGWVQLMGIPDRPETLPGSEDFGGRLSDVGVYTDAELGRRDAFTRLKLKAAEILVEEGAETFGTALENYEELFGDSPTDELAATWDALIVDAALYLGEPDRDSTATTVLSAESSKLTPELREAVTAQNDCPFSIYMVTAVHEADSTIDVEDMLRQRTRTVKWPAVRNPQAGLPILARVVEFRGETQVDTFLPLVPDRKFAEVAVSLLGDHVDALAEVPVDDETLWKNNAFVIDCIRHMVGIALGDEHEEDSD